MTRNDGKQPRRAMASAYPLTKPLVGQNGTVMCLAERERAQEGALGLRSNFGNPSPALSPQAERERRARRILRAPGALRVFGRAALLGSLRSQRRLRWSVALPSTRLTHFDFCLHGFTFFLYRPQRNPNESGFRIQNLT